MPLWCSIPAALAFGVSSWISSLDPNVGAAETWLLCGATAAAATTVALRLLRVA